MEIQVVRHHRGAEDTDGDVEHVAVPHDLQMRHEAGGDARQLGARQPELHGERSGDHQDEADDECFDVAEATVLEEEDDEDVERSQAHAPDERQTEQQVQCNGGSDDFGEVAGAGDFAEQPERDGDRLRVAVAAGLARSRPLAMPRRAARAWRTIAMTLEMRMTLRSV